MFMLSCRYHKLSAGNCGRGECLPVRTHLPATARPHLKLRADTVSEIHGPDMRLAYTVLIGVEQQEQRL